MFSIASRKPKSAPRPMHVEPSPRPNAPAASAPVAAPAPVVPLVAQSAGGESRNAPRRPAAAMPSITGMRISPHGVDAALVNISTSGVLAECGERLKPGSLVTVVFEGTFLPRTIEGRVARNSVWAMGKDGRLRYHVGISFANAIELPQDDAPVHAPQAAVAPAPSPATAPVTAQPVVRNRW